MAADGMQGGNKLAARLKAIQDGATKAKSVQVGFLAGATYPDGTSVPMVAAIQEFGSPKNNIPPRPFFRTMVASKSPAWGATLGNLLAANNFDAARALDLMGAGIAGQLRQSIIDLTEPALSPITIARKGFSKPLVDTGHMLNSVDHEVQG